MTDKRSLRGRMFSARALIAVGGVAAATFGLAQASGTLANPMQSVKTSSDVSVGNLYPTPLPETINCSNDGSQARVFWSSAGPGMSYQLEVWENNKSRKRTVQLADTSYKFNWGSTAKDLRVRVHTVNEASGIVSTGYVSHTAYNPTVFNTYCTGEGRYDAPNQAWENQHEWSPGDGVPNGIASRAGVSALAAPMIDAFKDGAEGPEAETSEAVTAESTTPETTTPEAEAPEITTSESSAPETTTSAQTPGTSTPTQTTPPTSTTTEQPTPVLTNTVESGGMTAGWLPGGNKVAVLGADGEELASGRAEKGSTLHWYNGQLWIVGETEVYRIMESPQDGKWKFYRDSGQNMPTFE